MFKKKQWKNVSIGHGCPCFKINRDITLKQLYYLVLIKFSLNLGIVIKTLFNSFNL